MRIMLIKPFDLLKKSFPVAKWLPKYDSQKFVTDLIAGITVGMTLIPQSIAYAALAGVGPQFGLYSSICGGFLYAIFGTIAELNIAPTAIISLLTFSYTENLSYNREYGVVLLCFLSGLVEIAFSILRLGFLVDFVSTPVVAGLTSVGAITVASAQVKNLFGIKSLQGDSFVLVCFNFFKHIDQVQLWDTFLGLSCCAVLLSLRKLKDFGAAPFAKDDKEKKALFKNFLWFTSISRNALVVILTSVMSYVLSLNGMFPFSLTYDVPSGLPNFSVPVTYINTGNVTYTFLDLAKELNTGILMVPLLSILTNVAVAKAFAKGKMIDATQEMLAVGLCNLFGSFISSMPVSASFSRAGVANSSGARTPLNGIYTSIMVILALTFITPYFYYIPKPTLAAVIMCAVYFMIEWTISRIIWKLNQIDVISYFATVVFGLILGLEIGIIIGIISDLVIVLYYSARPKILAENVPINEGMSYLRFSLACGINYSSAEYIRNKIMKYDLEYGKLYKVIVMDFGRVSRIDYTSAMIMGTLVNDLQRTEKRVIFLRPKPTIAKILTKTCGRQYCVANSEDAIPDLIYGQIANIKPRKTFYYAIETTQM